MIIGGVIMLIPFVWMISTMLKFQAEVMTIPPTIIPRHPTLTSLKTVWSGLDMLTLYKNSIIMTLGATLGQIFLCSMAGYAFAKIPFSGRQTTFILVLSTMMVPLEVIVVPLYFIMFKLHWVNTYFALFVPWITHAFGIFLMKQYIGQIPDELVDAAIIDGCSYYGVYARIILPNIKPALAMLVSFIFMWQWNAYLWPLVVINSKDMYTLTIGITEYVPGWGDAPSQQNLSQAAAFLSIFVPIAVFIRLQKYFLQAGLTAGLKF